MSCFVIIFLFNIFQVNCLTSADETVVRFQNIENQLTGQLFQLEKRLTSLKNENSELSKSRDALQNIVYSQKEDIAALDSLIDKLDFPENQTNSNYEPVTQSEIDNSDGRHTKRRIIYPRQSRVNSPAFYAYMSTNEASPGQHHTLIFNSVITNIGNAYNQYSGIFTVPSNGMYVLSYTITSDSGANIPVEIVKNAGVIGSLLTRTYSNYRHSVSSTVVVSMNAGDVCYVRTSGSGATTSGNIFSGTEARTSFTGWRIE
ncbi:Hypothetical predicted protein [Mytilus galloprovincialis]|uniref:C1q domain-containing protein n=1 Tax=Mytilus galloprovincialis TaxID=29158 RepID=A0A8B6BKZ5_MYTGA|nr:Hypothetical predicted protein [Mytilus galloprovincialis]